MAKDTVLTTKQLGSHLALDRLELQVELKELPSGPVEIVLHSSSKNGGKLGGLALALEVNRHRVDNYAMQTTYRITLPSRFLEAGTNTIRLSREPLVVDSITLDARDDARADSEPAEDAHGSGQGPLTFGPGTSSLSS